MFERAIQLIQFLPLLVLELRLVYIQMRFHLCWWGKDGQGERSGGPELSRHMDKP